MNFRNFQKDDADFCFRTRSSAFIKLFYNEIGVDAVSLCVNSILPNDYVLMSSSVKIFIADVDENRVGFCTIKKGNNHKVEVPLIYFDLNQIGKGYGSKSMKYLENWVKNNWIDTTHIYLDTIIPKYNSGFYKKMGYRNIGKSSCEFFGENIPAIRFEKML